MAAKIRGSLGVALVATLLGCRADRGEPAPPAADPLPSALPEATAPGAPGEAPSAPRAAPTATAPRDGRFAFDFDDADLPDLVRLVSRITGKRFLYSGKMPTLHASAHAPDRVTAEEAYRAFLTILQENGLTVVERGRFYQIMASPGLPVDHGAGR